MQKLNYRNINMVYRTDFVRMIGAFSSEEGEFQSRGSSGLNCDSSLYIGCQFLNIMHLLHKWNVEKHDYFCMK